jgi:thiosulfate/3-mercaptopyruvate sulfurtransferase
VALVSVAQLADRISDPHLRVADVRWYLGRPGAGRAAYEAGHIPGAIFLDLDEDLADMDGLGAPGRHPLPTAAAFTARMAAAGIGSDDFVVPYDDAGGTVAARLWWMLDNLIHRGGVAVLDGGIQAWIAAGHELSRDEPHFASAELELADEWHGVISRDELAGRLGAVSLLDARAPERYRGEVEPVDPVAGHIPTALNVPVAGNMDEERRMLPPAQLRQRYAAVAGAGQPIVVACGSGTNACHNALAMRLAGMADPILYVGSYSDWSRSRMPIATGETPGEMPR